MLSEKENGAISDILEYGGLAIEFLRELSPEALALDRKSYLAVVRCLEIVSEASRRLPEELKAAHPAIDWRSIAAAGNFYRHDYLHVTPARVWATVTVDLPVLLAAMHSFGG